MTPCDSLAAFCDGELEPADAWNFRAHLRACEPCQAEVLEHMALCARLSDLQPKIETAPVRRAGKEETT